MVESWLVVIYYKNTRHLNHVKHKILINLDIFKVRAKRPEKKMSIEKIEKI